MAHDSIFNRRKGPIFAKCIDQVTGKALEGEDERVQKANQEHNLPCSTDDVTIRVCDIYHYFFRYTL